MSNPGACVPLAEASDASAYGGKAAHLAGAISCRLPVPRGWAIGWAGVAQLCGGGAGELEATIRALVEPLGPVAVRSSAVGEDSQEVSFAGMHLSVLGVVGADAVLGAVGRVYDSAVNDGALAYRRSLGIDAEARMGVVIQEMVHADVAGVMFTRNPVTGAGELVIEASWGLGESVVSGIVTPDHVRADLDGRVLEQIVGDKDVALRLEPDGSTMEHAVPLERALQPCLTDAMVGALRDLVKVCDRAYADTDHDIEFAFCGDSVHLLQRRPLTDG